MSDVKPYTTWQLYKWSVLIRQRDEMVCFMCKRDTLKRRELRELKDAAFVAWNDGVFGAAEHAELLVDLEGQVGEAHHIAPKFHYPERALELHNGVCLCWRCHRQVVHSTYETYSIYRHAFAMYNRRKTVRLFNEENQERV